MEEPIPAPQPDSRKPGWATLLAVSGCAVFICAAIFVATLLISGPQVVREYIPNMLAEMESHNRMFTQSNTMGDPDAPIYIIEYGDFQCPYCLQFWRETEPKLIEQYINTGKVYFEFRSFPFLGEESVRAAEAAYCAGDQGKFWEYHDTLFENWTGENVGDFTDEKLIGYAKENSLDMTLFESCIRERMHKGTVEQDLVMAEADGVHATPTFIINGYKVEGAQPFEFFQRIIEDAINGILNEEQG
jgi:predicted DsbA family dithiol-disulfide isomerase